MKQSWGILAVSVATILALAGCTTAPTEATPSERPTSTSTPSASATAEPIATRPEPRMSLSCEQILPADDAAILIGADAIEQTKITAVDASTPVTSAVFNLGARFCEWGNMPRAAWWNAQADYRGASLKIVPVTDVQWQSYAPEAGSEDPAYPGVMISIPGENVWAWCWAPDANRLDSSCYAEGNVNGYWISFESTRLNNDQPISTQDLHALFRPTLDRIIDGLNQQTLPAIWPGNPEAGALSAECVDYLSVEQGEALTGHDISAIGIYWDGPRRGLSWMAMKDGLATNCDLMLVETEGTAAKISAMQQGSWRVNELNSAYIADGSAVPIALTGLSANESSALRCADEREMCEINMSYKGHWLRVAVDANGLGSGGLDHVTGRANITQLAETVLANLAAAA